MRNALWIVALAACGGTTRPTPGAPADPTAAVAPCPSGAALDQLAARAWSTTDAVQRVWCTALRVDDHTEWWLAGEVHDEDPDSYGWTPREALVTAKGDVLWWQKLPFDDYQPEASEQQARDLDGDGVDELIYVSIGGEGGGTTTALIVVGLAGGKPRSARADLGYSYLDDECLASWQVDGPTIVVSGEGACASFSGRFRWDGSTLVSE